MTRAKLISLSVLFFAFGLAACKNTSQPQNVASGSKTPAQSASTSLHNTNQPSQPENANAKAASSKDAAPAASASDKPAQLLGEYEAREIENQGVVTMVSSALQTRIYFLADGNYSRTSKKGGRIYHTDSGQFRIEPPDKLVLTILMSGKGAQTNLQKPPIQKTHKFSLSPDGEELRLTNEKGSVAVFRRVAKPKAG